jgi:hypothetical protein
MKEVTDEMLITAVKEAVKQGIIPKYASEELYLKNYKGMKKVLEKVLENE